MFQVFSSSPSNSSIGACTASVHSDGPTLLNNLRDDRCKLLPVWHDARPKREHRHQAPVLCLFVVNSTALLSGCPKRATECDSRLATFADPLRQDRQSTHLLKKGEGGFFLC